MKKKQQEEKTVKGEIISWVISIATAVVIALILRSFVFTMIRVDGKSMLETLQNGDRLYVSKLTTRFEGYDRGDIAICVYDGADHYCVKRVIGLPGDTVEIISGQTYVNGEAVDETGYITHADSRSLAAVTLGEGEYFMMGDNRPVSKDSRDRTVGPVTEMVGKARFIVWPLSRIGGID